MKILKNKLAIIILTILMIVFMLPTFSMSAFFCKECASQLYKADKSIGAVWHEMRKNLVEWLNSPVDLAGVWYGEDINGHAGGGDMIHKPGGMCYGHNASPGGIGGISRAAAVDMQPGKVVIYRADEGGIGREITDKNEQIWYQELAYYIYKSTIENETGEGTFYQFKSYINGKIVEGLPEKLGISWQNPSGNPVSNRAQAAWLHSLNSEELDKQADLMDSIINEATEYANAVTNGERLSTTSKEGGPQKVQRIYNKELDKELYYVGPYNLTIKGKGPLNDNATVFIRNGNPFLTSLCAFSEGGETYSLNQVTADLLNQKGNDSFYIVFNPEDVGEIDDSNKTTEDADETKKIRQLAVDAIERIELTKEASEGTFIDPGVTPIKARIVLGEPYISGWQSTGVYGGTPTDIPGGPGEGGGTVDGKGYTLKVELPGTSGGPNDGSLKILKLGFENGEEFMLPNVGFTIKKLDEPNMGKYVSVNAEGNAVLVDMAYTLITDNKNGEIDIKLMPEGTYELTETVIPYEEYPINPETKTRIINCNGKDSVIYEVVNIPEDKPPEAEGFVWEDNSLDGKESNGNRNDLYASGDQDIYDEYLSNVDIEVKSESGPTLATARTVDGKYKISEMFSPEFVEQNLRGKYRVLC